MNRISRYQFTLSLFILIGSISLTADASPAYRGVITHTEPDGTEVRVCLHGDEYLNYTTTTDGYATARGADGFYYYLDGRMRQTSLRVACGDTPQVCQYKAANPPGGVAAMLAETGVASGHNEVPRGAKAGRFPTSGSPRTVVILAQFTDEKFSSASARADFDEMLNSDNYTVNGATGSCRRYYYDNSMGKFNPQFDVYGPVTLSHDYRYYGENNPFTGSDLRASDMIIEACQALDDEIDFSVYDTDGDGIVDNVYVFYAGYGASDSGLADRVWPHSYDFGRDERRTVLDGKLLGNYACSNEVSFLTKKMTGIGTFVHEFGHCLGLPDLYNTANQGASFTPGEWDFMDYGMYNNQSRTPPCVTAYERIFLGWMEPQVLDQPDNLMLEHIAGNTAYRISTNLPDEYFLLENRQKLGWDTYIPGHGMLVWHIDYVKSLWDENRVNTNPSHQYVDILEADNLRSLDNVDGDPFPGAAGITAITDATQPNLRTWLGLAFGKTVTDIAESPEGIISFRYRGGATLAGPPSTVTVSDITPTSMKFAWTPVEGAAHYIVSLVAESDGLPAGNYGEIDAGDVTVFAADDLEPSTTYLFTVRAADRYSVTAPSVPLQARTLAPTFDLILPPAPGLISLDAQGARIALAEIDGADGYLLNVYEKTHGEAAACETLGFEGGPELPQGWESTATSTISMSGFYGAEAPALVLNADGLYLQTPVYPLDISALSFWMRGRSDVSGNSMAIFGNDGRRWMRLTEMEVPATASTVIVDPDLVEGCRSVRIVYNKTFSAGNAVIDDVEVQTGATISRVHIPGFEQHPLSAAGVVNVGPLPGNGTYYASYAATGAGLRTRFSPELRIMTGSGSSLSAEKGATPLRWRADGASLCVTTPSAGLPVALRTAAGATVAFTEADAEGLATLPLPGPGVYLLTAGPTTVKIIL